MSADFVIIVTGVLVAVPCALLGTLLVLRQMSMMGDAISHAVLPGIVFAFFVTGSLGPLASLVGAGIFGFLCAVLVEALKNTGRVKEDSSIGIVFTALFALGAFLISRFARDVHLDLQHVLFGEIAFAPLNTLTVGGVDLGPTGFWTLGIVTVLAGGLVAALYKELKLSTFDPGLAAAAGFSPVLVHYLLVGTVSVTVVGAFDAVGAILVVAFLIVPSATAYLLTDKLSYMMGLAVLFGVVSAVSGYYVSAAMNLSIAGMMAVMTGALFTLALLLSPSRGLVANLLRRRRNRRTFSRDLVLARLERLGGETTEEELSLHLDWEGGRLAATLGEASRTGLVQISNGRGEVSLTPKGQDSARAVSR
ncbi:MAG: metal ABC transporter permease [Rubrobacter sp.]|nr:metal ABC transporter permease [Rubrobacter sp.]